MNKELVIVDGKHMIGEYQAFPIYFFSIKWNEVASGKTTPNAASHSIMYREEQSQEQLSQEIKKEVDRIKEKREVTDLVIEYNLRMYETWNLQWFSHYTFDIGQTDEEAIDSFEQFVQRHESYQGRLIEFTGDLNKICLMGAEDRYRWHSVDNNKLQDYRQVPCRCIHCKEQGLLRINH